MASWLNDLEDDWISDGQLPPKLHIPAKTSISKNGPANVQPKPVPQKSLIPRPTSKKPHLSPKRLAEGSTSLPGSSPPGGHKVQAPPHTQDPSPDVTPQGTVQKFDTNVRLGILVDRGNEDLFSPTRLESLFEPLSDGSRSSYSPEPEPSHQSEDPSDQDVSGVSQDEGAIHEALRNTSGEQSPPADRLNHGSESQTAPHLSSMLEYESEDPLERSAWNSTPPPFIAWRPTASSTNQDTSLFQEDEASSLTRDDEYINSISTSAFSDQSPGLNGLLHVSSRSEHSKKLYGKHGGHDFQPLSPEQSILSHSNKLYFTTPDRKVLWRINSGDASLELPDISPKEWSPLKLFSSDHNSIPKNAIHGRMSHLGLVNSPYSDKILSENSTHNESSLINRSKRLLDGTPASYKKAPARALPQEVSRSDSLHPPSPVKESQPKRQKLNLSAEGTVDEESESTGEDFDSDASVLRHPSGRVTHINTPSERQDSTSKLLLDPEINFSQSPHPNFLSDPHSAFTRAASLHSLNVILASKVKHMMPRKVGSMVFDEERQVWRHQDDVIDSMRRDLLDSAVQERSTPAVEDGDPFEEISDLTASLSSRLVLSHDQSGAEMIPLAFRNLGPSPAQGNGLSAPIESPQAGFLTTAAAPYYSEPSPIENTSTSSKEGVRPTSPDVDPRKSIGGTDVSPNILPHLGPKSSGCATGVNKIENERFETDTQISDPDTKTPATAPQDGDGGYVSIPRVQNTPCQPFKQYTISMQTNGRPINGTLLNMRKPESSFWNTPLTDITYHFLEADSRMQSSFSRGYHSRNNRQLRKFPPDRTSLALKSMVRHLTDNDMFGPYWDQNKALQIQKQGLEHLQDLASFHPNLVEVNLEHNQLTHLTGMPSTVRDLKVAGNLLSSLTAWTHLKNIQFLDISSNRLDSLSGLSGLIHLRELKADSNQIASLDGILHLDGLVKLRLRLNLIHSVNFGTSNLKHLKALDLGGNKIESFKYLNRLPEVSYLNLDSNNLTEFTLPDGIEVRSLRTLDLSKNKLQRFTTRHFPNIKTLYLDSNCLDTVDGIASARYLDSFSFRSQAGPSTVNIPFNSFYELRKVYASGNPISALSVLDYFVNMQYLELASCNIRTLPSNFGRLMTNIRVINLNNNALSDIKPLYGIVRLKKLYLMGNRISNLQKLNNVLKFLPFLTELDLRQNPLTLGFYGILYQCTDLARSENSEEVIDPSPFLVQHQDKDSDERFQRSMTEDTAVARRCYDILIGEQCPQMSYLDGLAFDIKEKLRHDLVWERMTNLGLLFDTKSGGVSNPPLDS